MKRFVLGFIIGGVICSALTGFAVEYAVTANPFPVKVNGVEKSIEGYNINDNTYFKLRDVADAVGAFTVGFADNTITIDTPQIEPPEPSETPSPAPSAVKPTLNPNKEYILEDCLEYTMDDGLEVYNFDGKYYVNIVTLMTVFDWHKFDANYILDYNDYISFLSLDYYQNTVLPNADEFRKN